MSNPIVTLEMQNEEYAGQVIKIELFPDKAPNTVKNFVSLVKKGHYNGIMFHRVIEGFMIQGGCPLGNGTGDAGYKIKGEFKKNRFAENDLKHTRGVISMARAQDKDSGGSQFFIMHLDANHLDGDYAGFGKMIEGYELLDAIANCDCDRSDKPKKDQIIKCMTVENADNMEEPEIIKY